MHYFLFIVPVRAVEIQCDSVDYKAASCDAGGVVIDVTLTKQYSTAKCVEGRTFGSSGSTIWVEYGCRAKFTVVISGNNISNYKYPVNIYIILSSFRDFIL